MSRGLARVAWLASTLLALGAKPARTEPPHPALAMDAQDAFAAAERLVGSSRHLESLPYFERLIALLPGEWALLHDHSNALQGAAFESRTVLGRPLRAMRSSFESIVLMRRALAGMDGAQELALSPRARATVHLSRSRQLGAWGFPWDALAEAHAAARADPSWDRAALAARQWRRRLAREPGY